MATQTSEILPGTLDLMVLKTLDAMGPMHGYGLALRIEQISEDALRINQGTIYLCLFDWCSEDGSARNGVNPRTTGARSSTRSPRPGDDSCNAKPRTGSASPES